MPIQAIDRKNRAFNDMVDLLLSLAPYLGPRVQGVLYLKITINRRITTTERITHQRLSKEEQCN